MDKSKNCRNYNICKKEIYKNNKIMAFVTIEDLNGSVENIIFEPTFKISR